MPNAEFFAWTAIAAILTIVIGTYQLKLDENYGFALKIVPHIFNPYSLLI